MKTKLEELTVREFIELVSGNTSVLHSKAEVILPAKLSIIMRNIVFEYKEIADKSGATSYISELDVLLKARMSAVVFSMCQTLVGLRAYDEVRVIMDEYGINVGSLTEAMLKATVDSHLERAKKEVAELEAEQQNDSADKTINIRREFDAQTAALMAYFKFQIDTSTMMATVYAHLVARHNAEIKAQLAALNK